MAKSLIPKGYKWALSVSHDVDHLKHYWNLDLLKFWGVSLIEFLYGKVSFDTFIECIRNSFISKNPLARISSHSLGNDSWNQIELLASINKKYKIPATFFFVMEKGRGIDYSHSEIKGALSKLDNFDTGVHGQDYENINAVEDEFSSLKQISGKNPEGIRMHYLNWAPQTSGLLNRAGYVYDSTEFSDDLKQPYKMPNGLVEIPLHIMDTYLFSPFYKNMSLVEAKDYTLKLINRARKEKKVLNILFHPRHLSTEFRRQREWYLWLLELAKNEKTCYKISLGEIAEITGAQGLRFQGHRK